MIGFVVGIAVGVAIALLVVIIVAPSRRVRDEPPLPMSTQLDLLLHGRGFVDPDDLAAASPAVPKPAEPATDWQFDTAQFQSLRYLDTPAPPDVPRPSD